MNRSLPTRSLREHPNLDQLRRQAKELLRAFIAGEQDTVNEVNTHYRCADPANFALHDAQLVLARAYGFASWPKLKAHVDGITLARLIDAVRADDLTKVRELLKVRPELAHMSMDNLQVLHHAVLNRSPEMVRILMQHGASSREGVYPHRDATSSLTIAAERGYDEIVATIREEEGRRQGKNGPATVEGWTPLHVAARALDTTVVASLLDRGADAGVTGPHDLTPLDAAAYFSNADRAGEFVKVATLLLARGAPLTPSAAVALGEAEWLRARHAESMLSNPIQDITGGLLRIAVSHNRPDMLSALLDFGFDPDERTRTDGGDDDVVVLTWGMPLWHCAANGKYDMAEMLLKRGADPNASVCASGDPVSQAYGKRDWKMVKLLGQYGGVATPHTAASYRQTELARKMLTGEAPYRSEGDAPLAEQLLGAAACGGDPEIVRLALERVDWPRDDSRWFGILEQPLRVWNHGPGHWCDDNLDRSTYFKCFVLILERCDANIRGRTNDRGQFGLTILHSVAGAREHVRPEERAAFATALLDAGARTDLRDNLLQSTPLGWACRWGRIELVKLLLEGGADPIEADAEPWATPKAWAEKMGHHSVLALLREHGA